MKTVKRFKQAVGKIKKLPELKRLVAKHKREGKKIVTTNGTYDLLHVGHLKVFEKAKSLGDVLIVGINSDKSVQGYKGPKRPIVTEKERAKLIAGLASVDYVLVFDEPTPAEWLAVVKPHVHVKGGDWKKENMPEWPVVEKYGGKMVRVPVIEGRSTTNIIEKVLEAYKQN